MVHANGREAEAVAVQLESELYAPVKLFFRQRGYDIKGEVMHCDLMGIHQESGAQIVVEMKKTFNLALLLQGVERQRICDTVYLAVERNRAKKGAVNQRYGELAELCRRLELGLLTVTFYQTKAPLVEVLCEPGERPVRRARPKRAERVRREFHARSADYNVGGVTGRPLITAYRERALQLAVALAARGELAPRELRELTGIASCSALLQQNHYGWFMRVRRGVYALTDSGHAALETYRDIL